MIADTDYLIAILRGKPVKRYKGLKTTVINAYEILRGGIKYILRERKIKGPQESYEEIMNSDLLQKICDFLSEFEIYPFDSRAAMMAAFLRGFLEKKGELVELADIMIASIAIVNSEKLLTRNLKHFKRIPFLKIEEWKYE